MWSYSIFALLILCLSLWVGDIVNMRTKGILSGLLIASVIYIAGYLSGIIPTSQPADLGLGAIISAYGMLIIVTNVGTMISLTELMKQWRTVIIALFSILFMGIIIYFTGTLMFGREIGMLAIAPISGGAVATMIVANFATEAGRADLAALAMLFNVVQLLFGVPVSSWLLNKYCKKVVNTGEHLQYVADNTQASGGKGIRFLKPVPKEYNTPYLILAKLAAVGTIAAIIGKVTNGAVPATVAALILGVIFTEIGFLDKEALSRAGFYSFIMFAFMALLIASFSSLTVERLLGFIAPLFVLLLIGVITLSGGSMIMGIFLKVDWRLAAAFGPAAMFGYPFSQIISMDVVKGMGLPKEESDKLLSMVMPQMIVAGFVTVTVASVFIASFIGPYIFK